MSVSTSEQTQYVLTPTQQRVLKALRTVQTHTHLLRRIGSGKVTAAGGRVGDIAKESNKDYNGVRAVLLELVAMGVVTREEYPAGHGLKPTGKIVLYRTAPAAGL